jgi:uncharacterized protein
MDHIERVYNLSMHLAQEEDTDIWVLGAAALLHDVARHKEDADQTGKTDHAIEGAERAGQILTDVGFPKEKIAHVQECIRTHRSRTDRVPSSIEAKILFDADKIDSIGAIGVARSYMWIQKNNAKMYDKRNWVEYAEENLFGGKLNGRIMDKTKHSLQADFETKGKFLPEKMHTKKGKEIAKQRIEYMRCFLERLEKEVLGEV